MKKLFILPILVMSLSKVKAQLLINEISASCTSSVVADDNNHSQDWIEVYNPTSGSINASAYYLSDKANTPKLWQMPNVVIPAGGFMKVYCSEENRVNGIFYHTNFKIDRQGEKVYLANAAGIVLDSKQLSNLELNHSYGRIPDGSPTWAIFNTPTAGMSNNSSVAYTGYANSVTVTPAGGFYGSAQSVTLTCPGFQIRYTTDGSEPTASSLLYVSPIPTNTTTIIKAKAFPTSGFVLPSVTSSQDYFISETGLGNLPVISITMNPSEFSTVYNAFWFNGATMPSRKAHLQYFNPIKQKQFETDFDLELHGCTSINVCIQKSFKVDCRGYYNDSKVKYALFNEKAALNKFDGFILRSDNGGKSTNDGIMERLLKGTNNPGQLTYIDNQAYQPCVVFVNGNYWGEYQIREKADVDWTENNFGVNADSVDFIHQKFDNLNTCANTTTEPVQGSDTGFVNLRNYMLNNNPITPAFYNHVDSKLDIKNYVDYFAVQTYMGNWDWINSNHLNNIKVWRKQGTGPNTKWRYFMYDLDYMGWGGPTYQTLQTVLTTCTNSHSDILKRFLMNTDLRNYFINRYADLMNTVFQPSNFDAACYLWRDSIDKAMPRHWIKWPAWGGSYASWLNNAPNMIAYNNARLPNVRNQIQTVLGMNKQVTTTFEVYPAGAGVVQLNTIEPKNYPWSGVYYDGCPISIAAKATNNNYVFDHWESTDLGSYNTSPSYTFNVGSTQTIKLFFKLKYTALGVNTAGSNVGGCSIFPTPASNVLKIKLTDETIDEVKINLYSVSGVKVEADQSFSISGNVFDVSSLIENKSEGVYFLEIKTKSGVYNEKIVVAGKGN